MKVKTLLGYLYWVLEFFLLLSITATIVYIGLNCYDDSEYIDSLGSILVGMLWLWFIFLPIFIIVLFSFIRCLIPPTSICKKVVLFLHILNVVLLFMFYIILPKPEPCDAALMEKHFKIHQDEMYDLVRYVRSALDDSCSITLEYRDNKVKRFIIDNNSEHKTCTSIKNQEELEKILHTAGLSMQELTVIQEKMHKAGIIGIDIEKNPISGYMANKSILQYRWYGINIYEFALYDRPLTEEEKHDASSMDQFIVYNDSVVFESYGGYPGGRGFPDIDEYQSQHH